jgi:two-component system, OmpR family, sensor histidine kinase ChvG
MIASIKAVLKQHWPKLRLRTILLGVLLFVAGLPGVGAIFLRVYENTLVRQTEAELVAQGATLVAAAGGRFPKADPKPDPNIVKEWSRSAEYTEDRPNDYYLPEPPALDLSRDSILPERPAPVALTAPVAAKSQAMAANLRPILEQTQRTTLASILLVDANGTVLNGRWKGQSYATLPEVKAALAGRKTMVLRNNASYQPQSLFSWLSRASALRIHHARPIIIDGRVEGVVLLSRSSRALFKGLYQDWGKITLGIALIFATLVFLSLLLHRAIAKPIEALSVATRHVAVGQGQVPDVPTTAAIEIQALYQDFAVMAEAISRRSRYLRDFAAALSHEFKTPLAGIRGAIELLEDHHGRMSDAERNQFLSNISQDAQRLSALVGRLMDLARADMAQPEVEAATALAPVIAKAADAMRGPRFSISSDIENNAITAAVDPAALESILVTLMENAGQAGATAVQLAAIRNGRDVQLTLSDNGPGIAPADRERLFEPFFTTRRATGGTGLGLAIARALIEAHRGRLELVETEKGAAFRILIPVAAPK